ncbi:MAG: alginate O-acetyltransferase complex protein AlgI, partial [bacterium]
HIAIGCAKLMGIKFPENFNFPYLASSFRSFWKRWHISLSSWIRDYLYLPILGVKVIDRNSKSQGGIETIQSQSVRNPTFALFATWALMGLWHGANWTFMLWGVYHAVFIYLERLVQKLKFIERLRTNLIGWLIVLPIAMLSWIPFRAASLAETFTMYSKLFQPSQYLHYSLRENNYLIVVILLLGVIISSGLTKIKLDLTKPWMIGTKIAFDSIKYSIMLFLVFVFLRPISQFIYFQF